MGYGLCNKKNNNLQINIDENEFQSTWFVNPWAVKDILYALSFLKNILTFYGEWLTCRLKKFEQYSEH